VSLAFRACFGDSATVVVAFLLLPLPCCFGAAILGALALEADGLVEDDPVPAFGAFVGVLFFWLLLLLL